MSCSSSEDDRKLYMFIIEAGIKLEAKNVTTCTAAILTYRVLKRRRSEGICPYTIACACILLAAKAEEDQSVRIRDVINVAYSILHPEKPFLRIGEELWAMREGIARMEYLVLRLLKFDVGVENPHQYLLHYLSSLRDWCPEEFSLYDIPALSFTLLRDAHVCPSLVLSHNPQTIAIVCLAIALRTFKVRICSRWYKVFSESMTSTKLRHLEKEYFENILQMRLERS
uniref:Cyclin-Q n=1 Tax=Syphacia muris TaxID=451379 RepID=A0A0N5AEQ5_9BILA